MNVFGRKEIVPQFAITDAVRDHKIEADYTRLDYNQGKITASGLLGAVAFGTKCWGSRPGWFDPSWFIILFAVYFQASFVQSSVRLAIFCSRRAASSGVDIKNI